MKLISFLFTFAAALGFASALSEALRGSMEDRAEQRTFHVLHDKNPTAAQCDEIIPKTEYDLARMNTDCFKWDKCPNPDHTEDMKRLVVSVLI